MEFGSMLDSVLTERKETQLQAAASLNASNSAISKVTLGTRKPSKELMQSAVAYYDEPFLAVAAATEATGGAFVPYMNNADLHRASTHLKTMEELEEAVTAMRLAPITKRKDQLSADERELIRRAIFECVEAITALTHHVAVLCKEYAFSWFGVWKEHRAKLKAHKYIS
ncbi:XRE family transcriptional regulator [Paenibacillus aurantiacus]|uniref:XRE family transcriptional regulator n=1 Tax=Paenibacillus aurantiacus TaxID=1936118 RepID=A0ABV5KP25_9BACL